jgi:hypothetical protein
LFRFFPFSFSNFLRLINYLNQCIFSRPIATGDFKPVCVILRDVKHYETSLANPRIQALDESNATLYCPALRRGVVFSASFVNQFERWNDPSFPVIIPNAYFKE